MEIRATLKHFRVSPRKARLVIDTIRGLKVEQALTNLTFMKKRVSPVIKKLLASAIANAEHNQSLQRSNLYVKEIIANDGKTLKRWMPRAHGRATPLLKRASHITIVLDEIEKGTSVKTKKTTAVLPAPTILNAKPSKAEGDHKHDDSGEETGDTGERGKISGGKGPKVGGRGIKRLFQRKSGGS